MISEAILRSRERFLKCPFWTTNFRRPPRAHSLNPRGHPRAWLLSALGELPSTRVGSFSMRTLTGGTRVGTRAMRLLRPADRFAEKRSK